jgi:chromatin remodeling complex protein RSC6
MAGQKGVKNNNSKKKVKKVDDKVKKVDDKVKKVEVVEVVEDVKVVEEVKVVEDVKVVEEVKVDGEEVKEDDNDFETLKNSLTDVLAKVNTVDEICIKDILKFKKELASQLKTMITQTKKLEKKVGKNKTVEKKKRKVTTSGFDKEVDLIKEAKSFITKDCKGNVGEGHPVSRRDVNKFIHTYIKANDLQNPENRRQIKPDKALQSILSPLSSEKNKNGIADSDAGYNYFNLQRYIKHIFIKIE